MKYILIIVSIISHIAQAQINFPSHNICNTFESMEEYNRLNPHAETREQFESWLLNKLQERSSRGQSTNTSYVIPVIFHIIHNGESVNSGSNISATKIISQLWQLNDDFANRSGSLYSVAANMDIQFCLARVSPNNTPLTEPGIERINRNSYGWIAPPFPGGGNNSYIDATIMPSTIWDPYRYFNIWVLEVEGVAGKGTFPASSGLPGISSLDTDSHSGVFIDYRSVGSINNPGLWGTENKGFGRVLTHEAGHFFGLRHIWGDQPECQGTDYCSDTPNQYNETYGCPDPGTWNGCFLGGNKMFENYMDYSGDGCMNTFTSDQKTRMQTVMAFSPRRSHLATSNVCQGQFPDLIIQNAQVPASPILVNSLINVSCSNKNQGMATAGNTITAVWLSSDQVFNVSTDINLSGDMPIPSLQAGVSSSIISKQISIPSGIAPGIWYIMFGADALDQVNEGPGETNNRVFLPITITTNGCSAPLVVNSPANRYITSPSVTTFTATVSGSNNVYQWQYNTGNGWLNVPNTSPYSGVNGTTLQINSTSLGMSGYQYRLYVTSTCTSSTAISSPATLIVSAASNSACNNDYSCGPPSPLNLSINSTCIYTNCSTIGATPPSPNINFTSCSGNLYQSGRYDDDVWFTITPYSTSPVTIKVVPTSNLTAFDPVIGVYTGNCSNPTQIPGGCADVYGNGGTEQLTFTPSATTTYLIRVFGYGIGSSYAGNFNICVASPNITPASPDLIISNSQLSVNTACPAASVSVSYQVANIGGSSANSSTVKYYLSTNNTYSAGDISLGSTSITSINANSSVSKSKTFAIPSGISSGTWYILTIADFNNDVNEGSNGEQNNVAVDQIQIASCGGSADLTISYVSHTPGTITPGTLIRANHISRNIGSEYAASNRIGIYLSNDNVFDPGEDQYLDDWGQPSLDPNEEENDILNVNLPNCIPCGNYYVFLYIDYLNTVNEVNNTNNFASFPIQIVNCISCAYTVPSTGIAFGSSGGSGNVMVTSTSCCSWVGTTNDTWITIINGSGNGTGVLSYTVEPCNGSNRTGTITISGQTHTITQTCTQSCNGSQSFEWAVKAGSSTLSDAASDVTIDASGNLFMTGDIQGAADFGNGIVLTTPSTAPDIFVSKHNSGGQIQWAQRFGGTSQEEGIALKTDSEGNSYIVGYIANSASFAGITISNNGTNNDAAFLLKLNASGVVQWAKKINASNYARPNDIVIDNSNNIFVTGDYSNYSNGDNAIFVSKFNNAGDQIWYNLYGQSSNLVQAYGISVDNSGNIAICGRFQTTKTFGASVLSTNTVLDIDGFVLKLDPAGTVLWARHINSPFQDQDAMRSLITDSSNNLYVVGQVAGTFTSGNITVNQTNGVKFVIIKFDSNGGTAWAKASISGTQYNKLDITRSADNDYYMVGGFDGSMQIDSFQISSNGPRDAFILRMDENAKVKLLKEFGGSTSEAASGVVTNAANDIFIAGDFRGTVNFGNTTLTSAGSDDIFLSKFRQCVLPIATISSSGNLCAGESVSLTTPYCSTNTYQWQLAGTDISGANAPALLATQAGSYTVKVVAFPGCEAVSSPVILNESPAVPTVTGGSICGSGTVLLTAAGAGVNENYKWYTSSTGGSAIQINSSSFTTPILSSTTTYYVTKYNINTLCESSPRIAVTATVINNAPTQQSTVQSFVVGGTTIAVTINPGNGTRRLVKINTTNSFTNPINGTDPTANLNYTGNGEQVVYNGNGTTFTVTGLLPNTNYCFRLYEANCNGTSSLYNIDQVNNNPSCQVTNNTGAPDLTSSQFFSSLQIPQGNTIDECIVIRNVGVNPTSAPIVFSITNYNALSGLTVSMNNSPTVTIGIDVFTLDNSNWTFDPVQGTITSGPVVVIQPGQARNIGLRFTRGTGNAAGANGSVTQTTTISFGTGGGDLYYLNNTISNTLLKN